MKMSMLPRLDQESCAGTPRWRRLIASMAIGVWLAVSAAASERVSSNWKETPPARELGVSDGTLPLDLQDAIAMALQRNLGLQVQRIDRAQFELRIQEQSGIYDLGLTASTFHEDEESATATALSGATVALEQNTGLNFRLDQLVSTGGVVSLDWRNLRRETNSIFFAVNPSFTTDFDLLFEQPLLRGFGRTTTERNLLVARTNSEISLQNLELAVIETIDAVENAYWQLVEARAQLEVDQESLALAEELHQMNQVQVEVGTLAPLELIQSEVGIATRQEAIIRSQAAVEDGADQLRRLLNLDVARYWDKEIVPTSDPEIARIDIDLEQAIQRAFAERIEIARQELQLENLELDSRVFQSLSRPQLDLQLRYGFNGLGGDVAIRPPGSDPFDPDVPTTLAPGGVSDAWSQVIDSDFPGWQVGLALAYPIQNRQARAQSTIADLALEQGRAQLEDVRLQVRTEVRVAARAVETAAKAIDSARVSRRLAEENLDAERKRYENGLSTSFQVLEIQEDLTQARSRLVTAITGYRRALVRYHRAIGRLLEDKGVELADQVDFKNVKP